MTSDGDEISWWRADARSLARWAAHSVRNITRADLIFIGYGLALCAGALFVWPAAPVVSLIWLPLAVRLFIWPDRVALAAKKRIEEGDDRYFEEQRALLAYPVGTAKQVRRRAAFLIALSVVCSAVAIYEYYIHHTG